MSRPRLTGLKETAESIMERFLLIRADRILAAKYKTIDTILAKYPKVGQKKCYVITNGYDPDDFRHISKIKKDRKFLRIVYSGKSEKMCRSPASFFRAIKELVDERKISPDKIKIIFFGGCEKFVPELIKEYKLSQILTLKGYCDHDYLLTELINADVLLFLLESSKGFSESRRWSGVLPAKIFEYLYSNVPILAIIPDGLEKKLLEEKAPHRSYIARSNDIKDIKEKVLEIWTAFNSGRLKTESTFANNIQEYDRKNLTKRLADIFEDLSLEKHSRIKY